jgi:hypothetical protein
VPLPHRPLRSQLRAPGCGLAVAVGAAAVVVALAPAAARQGGVGVDFLLRDPAAVAKLPFYVGLLSNLGVLLWAAAAGMLGLTCLAVRAREGWGREAAFFAGLGGLTALLAADDLFMLHEDAYRRVLPGPEHVVLGLEMLLLGAFVARFRARIASTAWLPLAAALGLLGLSAGVDLLESVLAAPLLLEDGAKLVGIAAWAYYAADQGLEALAGPPGV